MNLLDHLLGPAHAGTDPLVRHTVLDGDIPVFFEESIAHEDLAIGSWPGRMPSRGRLAPLRRAAVVPVASPLDERARDAISVDPATGHTLLLSLWPRALLTPQALAEILGARVRVHRFWQSVLLPVESDDVLAAWTGRGRNPGQV